MTRLRFAASNARVKWLHESGMCAVTTFVFLLIAASAAAQDALPAEIDFSRDIQPIFAARCLKCHGGDKAEGGLRLTDLPAASGEADSGERAIVPHQAERSELIRRISATEEAERMPPEGPPLAAAQIASLKSWINSGAHWPQHWAYAPLVEPAIPNVPAEYRDWVRTPIDAFVLDTLLPRGLVPSLAADRRTLLRRIYFDLIGLPPTAEEVDRFLADSSPQAYEKVVDELLASPHYGERWARHWMDLVHYAETHGHDQDRIREHAWPYRDWLIAALNSDKPYARFVEEQIAGDVLFPGDPSAIAATGMLATGPWDESSLRDIREDSLDRQVARYLDRDDIVTTVMSTFASSTVHCARCHDHKFDPISQREYFALQAVFAATDKANRAYDPDPQVAQRRRELHDDLAALPDRVARGDMTLWNETVAKQVARWEADLVQRDQKWQPVELIEFHTASGSELTKLDDNSLLAGGTRPERDTYTITFRTAQPSVTGLRLEALTHESLFHSGPGRQDNGNMHLNEVRIWAAADQPGGIDRPITIKAAAADFNQQGWDIAKAIDGSPATAWGIYPEVGKPHQALFAFAEAVTGEGPLTFKVELEQSHGGGHLIGRPRLSATSDSTPLTLAGESLTPETASLLEVPRGERTAAQRLELAAAVYRLHLTAELAALPAQRMVYCGTNRFQADGSFRPSATPRAIHLLKRGDITSPLEEVHPAALSCLPDLSGTLALDDPANEGQRRAALARWLTDHRNVLAWRNIANRVWQYHFGRGLVDTPNDFGQMGSAPTHPRLLDWLALELQASGGSLKRAHRLIVTSAVYRQSSAHRADFGALDADNRYLWRMNRQRLDAESLHDAVLRVAGSLDPTMGGPSVRLFNLSPGVHVTPVVDYPGFDAAAPGNYRRSVYRFVFRTIPDPFMEALDCPDSSQLAPKRTESLTALQALAILNDKFMVQQSEHLAQHAIERASTVDSTGSLESQVAAAYRLIFTRSPTERESAAVTRYASRHGLPNACRFLLNTNEFMFVD